MNLFFQPFDGAQLILYTVDECTMHAEYVLPKHEHRAYLKNHLDKNRIILNHIHSYAQAKDMYTWFALSMHERIALLATITQNELPTMTA